MTGRSASLLARKLRRVNEGLTATNQEVAVRVLQGPLSLTNSRLSLSPNALSGHIALFLSFQLPNRVNVWIASAIFPSEFDCDATSIRLSSGQHPEGRTAPVSTILTFDIGVVNRTRLQDTRLGGREWRECARVVSAVLRRRLAWYRCESRRVPATASMAAVTVARD